MTGPVWGCTYPFLETLDLDGNHRAEVLVAFQTNSTRVQLAALSGTNGHLVWQISMAMGSFAVRPDLGLRPVADLNSDGVLDLALWTPQDGSAPGPTPIQLMAFNGRNGQPLWPDAAVTAKAVEGARQLLWPEPLVDDVDGDGAAEIVVTHNRGYDPQGGSHQATLTMVNGRTGQPSWSWTWPSASSDLWPPLILRTHGVARAWLCIGVQEKDSRRIVVLDAAGQVHHSLPLKVPPYAPNPALSVWRTTDLDGDGTTELIYFNDRKLCVSSGPQLEPRWQYPLFDKPGPPRRPAGTRRHSRIQWCWGPGRTFRWPGVPCPGAWNVRCQWRSCPAR